MASFTETMSASVTDSTVSSQSDKISANLSLTRTPALSLAASASAATELKSQSDFFSSSSSTYLAQNASSSISESLTLFLRVLRAIIMKNCRILPVIR